MKLKATITHTLITQERKHYSMCCVLYIEAIYATHWKSASSNENATLENETLLHSSVWAVTKIWHVPNRGLGEGTAGELWAWQTVHDNQDQTVQDDRNPSTDCWDASQDKLKSLRRS